MARKRCYIALYTRGIQRGQPLSEALREKGFPPIALALLESGEMSGNVGEALQYIASYYERERKYQQKIVSAISYPLFFTGAYECIFLGYYIIYYSIVHPRICYYAYRITMDDKRFICIRNFPSRTSITVC